MTASELAPDIALKALLDGKIETPMGVLAVYEYASTPNDVTASNYISLRNNGVINSITKPQGVFNGNTALRIHCRLNTDNTANVIFTKRVASMCEKLVNCKISGDYYFELDALNPITDITTNATTGYSQYILNVTWRTPTSHV